MKRLLSLRYHAAPLPKTAAWMISGGSAERWLAELARWRLPLAETRLFVVPHSATDRRPCGVLVVPPPGAKPQGIVRGQAYAQLAQRLYLPVEAGFDPAIEERELADLLPADDCTYVWHPAAGLIGLPMTSAIRVADLLQPPTARPTNWDRAIPGVALNERLHSIVADEPLDIEAMFDRGREDIGREPPTVDKLPPSPREPAGGAVDTAGRAIVAGTAKVVQWLTGLAPRAASQRTWVNDAQDWAREKLAQYRDALDAMRNRELSRLMGLLESNPDEGLKYALPMSNLDHRGLGKPSDKLPPRDVNFNLARLGGGRPGDYWHLPDDYRRQLLEKYRELANREIALGRHRRAAYIFAELLSDLRSAAVTLADGGHFREAAALYEERLQQPLSAAQCLQQGGCWTEAIALYERLGQHETVGDLHRQLEQFEQANLAYRRAVEEHRRGMNYLAAAGMLEKRLESPDEAQACLLEGWPYSGQAQQCLGEAFAMLGRQSQHDRALALVERLRGTVATSASIGACVEGLARVAISYPDARVQATAADKARIVAAERLAVADAFETGRLTDVLRRLVPEDKLLARDCTRFVQIRLHQREPAIKPSFAARRGPSTKSIPSPKLLKEIKLGSGDWKSVVSSGDVFYAAGYRDDDLILVRGLWDGRIHQPSRKPWRIEAAFVGNPILLACPPEPGPGNVFVHVVGGAPPVRYDCPFPPRDDFSDNVVAGSAPGITPLTIAICHGAPGVYYVADFSQRASIGYVISKLSISAGKLLGTWSWPLPDSDSPMTGGDPVMFVRDELVYLGLGDQLHIIGASSGTIELPSRIRGITGSLRFTRTRIAVTFERGGMILWGDTNRENRDTFAAEMHEPVAGFTRGGALVAASAQEIQVYSTQNERLSLRAEVVGTGTAPIAVLSTMRIDEFAIAHADGRILVYELPA